MMYSADKRNENIAKELKDKATVPVSQELNRLSQTLDTDIRENLPPQMLAVVVGVLKLVENIEDDQHESH